MRKVIPCKRIALSVIGLEIPHAHIHLIRTGIVGMSSLKHLDFTIEALKLRFDAKKGSHFDFTLYGTQTIWNGSPENVLNTFDFLMNPIGGDINTNLFFSYPLL